MTRKLLLIPILASMMVLPAAQADIVVKTPQAQKWVERNPGKEPVKAMKDGQPWEISVNWIHEGGTNSLSIEERDAIAASRLLEHAKRLVEENNADPDKPQVRFAGILYLRSDDGFSHTKDGGFISKGRHYECGGKAIGFVLTYP